MQRANHVRAAAIGSQEKSPPADANGLSKHRNADREIGGDLVKSFREIRQARDVIAGLQRIDARIASGDAMERTDDLLNFYRAAWAIFEQIRCEAAEDRDRRDFEAATGVEWCWFAGALDAFGFALLPPARRHALYKMGGGVTRGDVEGWNEYPGHE